MSTTTASTTLDVFQAIVLGVGQYLANQVPILLIFAFMFGMFASIIIILTSWKIR